MPVRVGMWRKLEALTATGLIAALNLNTRHVTGRRYGSFYSPSDGAQTNNALTEFRTACVLSKLSNWQIVCANKLVLLTLLTFSLQRLPAELC